MTRASTTRASAKSPAKKEGLRPKASLAEKERHPLDEIPKTLDGHPFFGLRLDEKQREFRDAIWDNEKKIVFCDSPAGTGKSTIAVATALLLVEYGMYDGIVYIISPSCERELGYLPGDVSEKTQVYSAPLYQALVECGVRPERAVIADGYASTKTGGFIEFMPDTFLRGSNFDKKLVLLEEMQNFSIQSAKKTLTRIKDTCKTVCIGHSGQRDIHRDGRGALARYIDHFKGDDRVAVCTLDVNYRGWVAQHADELPDEEDFAPARGIGF